MFIRLYRGIGPGAILLTIITGILIWMQSFIDPVSSAKLISQNEMPLHLIAHNLVQSRPFLATALTFILVLVIAFYLANFNTRLFFITERTLLPAALFIILSGFIVSMQVFNPVLPATLLLMLALDRVMASYRKSGIAYNYFDSSMILGIASLFYFNIIWFFPIIIIGILLIRTFNLREVFLSIFGVITPYLALIAVYYISGKDLNEFKALLLRNITIQSPEYYWSPLMISLLLVLTALCIISMVHLMGLFNAKKIKTRKTFSLLIWVMIITGLVYLFVPSASIELVYIFLIPYSFLVTHFIVFIRNKKIANIIFAIAFISVAVIQISRIYLV